MACRKTALHNTNNISGRRIKLVNYCTHQNQLRKGKLFTIITVDKITDDFTQIEQKMVYVGILLGLIGVVSFVAIIFYYG